MEKPGNDEKPLNLNKFLWLLPYIAVIYVTEKYWYGLTGYGGDFLAIGWIGVTALLAGFWIAGPMRVLMSPWFYAVMTASVMLFYFAYSADIFGAKHFAVPVACFGAGFAGIAGLIVCFALRPAPAPAPGAPARAGVNVVFTVIQAVLFWLLIFGLTAFVMTGWSWLKTEQRDLAYSCVGIIGVIELAVMGWAWWKLGGGDGMLGKGLALLFAVPLLFQAGGYVVVQTMQADKERQVASESAAMQNDAQITSYSENPIHLPGFDGPVGLEISVGLKITAPGNGMLQQPVFFHLPHGQVLTEKTNYCCAGFVDATLPDGTREIYAALQGVDPKAGPDGAPFIDDLGPLAQPWQGDGAVQTHEYSLFSPAVSSLGLSPPTVCMPKSSWPERLVASDLTVRWWMERRDVKTPDTGNQVNAWTGPIEKPGGDIGPVLRDYIVSHSSAMNDTEQWKQLVTAITPETLDKAGYKECESANVIIRCYCRSPK